MAVSVTREARRYHTVLTDIGPEALVAMREVTRIHLRLWRKEELSFTAELGVSELLTNVLVHAPGDCEVLVRETVDGVVVGVTDFDDALPVVKEPTEDQTGGRGLFLLSQLVDEFDIHQLTRGKQVWFRLILSARDDDCWRSGGPASACGWPRPPCPRTGQ
ncbi:ATP-binding protein [Streptoverticillium reticulum]|uniref:ATP-binding protein n=1 Tax=Streptoverticillium reticulum TaxID=1433415 RepID=UPI0039BEFA16